jgi:hypothetical protein
MVATNPLPAHDSCQRPHAIHKLFLELQKSGFFTRELVLPSSYIPLPHFYDKVGRKDEKTCKKYNNSHINICN